MSCRAFHLLVRPRERVAQMIRGCFFDMKDMARPSCDLNLHRPSKSGYKRQNYALTGGDDTAGI